MEVDRLQGALIDPRLGRITVGEWWERWWPTVKNLRPSTKARDDQYFRSHALPAFGRRHSPNWTARRCANGSSNSVRRMAQILRPRRFTGSCRSSTSASAPPSRTG
ncbi:MAG: hypothetical protein ACRDZ2_08070 [Ilumatobacteraceae bacterium]